MEGLLRQEYSVIVKLEIEEDPCQVKEEVWMIRGVVEGLAETFNRLLCVTFDPPKVANLIEDCNGLWVLQEEERMRK